MPDLNAIEERLLAQISQADNEVSLDAVRVAALGKKGEVTELMKSLGAMSPEERKVTGAALNKLKDRLNGEIEARQAALHAAALEDRLSHERVDVTMPVPTSPLGDGRIHPVSQVLDEIAAIFADLGFAIAEGPDIEDDFHNFAALNIPPEHPARQMHDTFYLNAGDDGSQPVLRTHTSPVQIRAMTSGPPPHRLIAPGRTYRCDSDQTHTPMFHQVEGLVIDQDTHLGHLKWCLEAFCKAFFEVETVKMRFRASHFPFTEPSLEVDIGCARLGNEIRVGEGDDWLEILGCGMVHPQVLRNVDLDPGVYQGFAFGVGVDRLAMLKYGIPDLRAFFDADLRWLRHYGFQALDMPDLPGGLSS